MPHGNETILIVDDEERLKELAREILETQGYCTLTAGDGKQALELLGQHPDIDLLFSNIVVPNGINGYELAEQATTIHDNLKILLTSGFDEKAESRNDHIKFNPNMLNKPYSKAELIKLSYHSGRNKNCNVIKYHSTRPSYLTYRPNMIG